MKFTVNDIKIEIGDRVSIHFNVLNELKKCESIADTDSSAASAASSNPELTDDEIPLDIDERILNLIKITINTYNTLGKFDFTDIDPTEIAQLYDTMVYYLDLKEDTHQAVLTELSVDLNYISKFSEVMIDDKNVEFIINIIKYRTKFNLDCASYLIDLNTYFQSVWATFAKMIRIAFIFDATASMRRYLDKQKKEAQQLYKNIYSVFGNIKLEIKLIGYRDYTCSSPVSEYDICKTPHEFARCLDNMVAVGGGDIAEAPELGLHALTKTDFFTNDTDCINIAIIIGDALPHDFLNKYVPEQTTSTHAAMCKEFTAEHGDWATLLVNLAQSYNVSIYGVNLKPTDLFMETWMSTISSISGTETQHSVESLNNTLIKDIISWSFERSLAMSKKASLSKEELAEIITKMNSKTTTILPDVVQRQLTADITESAAGSMTQRFEMAVHSSSHLMESLRTHTTINHISHTGGSLKRMKTGHIYRSTEGGAGAASADVTGGAGVTGGWGDAGADDNSKMLRFSSCPMPTLVRSSTSQMNRLSQLESLGDL